MKINKKDLALLSAYLDDELTAAKKAALEKKIAQSKKLKQALESLKKIKTLTAGAATIDPAPFFEEAVMYRIEHNHKVPRNKKTIFTFSGIAATLLIGALLLGLFDVNTDQDGNFTRFSLLNGYNSVLDENSIDKNDVFDFAVFNRLPIDKSKGKYLQISSDDADPGNLEISETTLEASSSALESFRQSLALDKNELAQLDSILESYADILRKRSLFRKDGHLALNAYIQEMNNSLMADLINFSRTADSQLFSRVLPLKTSLRISTPRKKQLLRKRVERNEPFMLITIDTLIHKPCEMKVMWLSSDPDSFNKKVMECRIQMQTSLQQIHEDRISTITIDSDTPGSIIVEIEEDPFFRHSQEEWHENLENLNMIVKGLNQRMWQFSFDTNQAHPFFNFTYPDGFDNFMNFGFHLDSLVMGIDSWAGKMYQDEEMIRLLKQRNKQLLHELEKMQNEMKKWKWEEVY